MAQSRARRAQERPGRARRGAGRADSAGGVLIIGISLKLLDLKDVRVGNFLPALLSAAHFTGRELSRHGSRGDQGHRDGLDRVLAPLLAGIADVVCGSSRDSRSRSAICSPSAARQQAEHLALARAQRARAPGGSARVDLGEARTAVQLRIRISIDTPTTRSGAGLIQDRRFFTRRYDRTRPCA